jgi:hypothetical protein
MFVYLLIAAELALIWWVYWYLYVREPGHHRHISGATWGSYVDSRAEEAALKAYVQQEEFVWDQRNMRYIPVSQLEAESLLAAMAAKLDRQFSQLNVKP